MKSSVWVEYHGYLIIFIFYNKSGMRGFIIVLSYKLINLILKSLKLILFLSHFFAFESLCTFIDVTMYSMHITFS